jgi:hypothetical protein
MDSDSDSDSDFRPAKVRRSAEGGRGPPAVLLPLEVLLIVAGFATPRTYLNLMETCVSLYQNLRPKITEQNKKYNALMHERALRNFYAQLEQCSMMWLAPIIASFPGTYIAGGFVTRAVSQGTWKYGDIDLWVSRHVNIVALRDMIVQALRFHGKGFSHDKDSKNELYFWAQIDSIENYYFPHPEMPRLQIMRTHDAHAAIQVFDFSFCACYFDGFKVAAMGGEACTMSNIVRRRGTICTPSLRHVPGDCTQAMLATFHRHVAWRVQKYLQRGFTITARGE